MLKDHERLEVPPFGSGLPLELEVNFNGSKDQQTNDCKILKISLGNKTTKIKYKDLWNLMFAMAQPEQQEKMIPTKVDTIRHVEQVIQVKAERNIKRGEMITFKYRMRLPDNLFAKDEEGNLLATKKD